jgi:uncharacterized protein YdeI (YjbR/CyaY-like superfamily)
MPQAVPERKLLVVSSRARWRAWLLKNHASSSEIWLVYFRKHTGRPRISYNDAVEEALCFGWIDSTVRSIDGDRFAQRFSVRRPGSAYSEANRERLRALVREGKVSRKILKSLPDLSPRTFRIPPDILGAVRMNRSAWKNFRRFSRAYIRIRVAYIEGARGRRAEYRKRLSHFVRMTELNRQFGFGGIDKHY